MKIQKHKNKIYKCTKNKQNGQMGQIFSNAYVYSIHKINLTWPRNNESIRVKLQM